MSRSVATAPPTDAPAAPTPDPGAGGHLLLVAVLGGMFLAMLDQTIVSTSLPRIVRDLHGEGVYSWVVTAYLLTVTITAPLYGRLSDRYGRRPLLLIGVSVFLLGSALCAVAQDMPQLIAYRGLQGIGAGALMPLSLALVADVFPPERRGQVQGALGAVMAVSYAAGPFLGGVLTDHASWRWVFLVNLPTGVLVLAVVALRLPNHTRPAGRSRPDYLGILVFTTAIALLLLGLSQKSRVTALHWSDPSIAGPLAASAVLIALFCAVESRAADPIVPLHLFRNRTYTLANLASAGSAFALYASIIFLPRYFQTVRGASATASGLRIYPLLLGMVLASVLTGALIGWKRRYRPWLILGGVLLGTGALLFTRLDAHTGTWQLAGWMLLVGTGIGPTMSGLTVAVQTCVPPTYVGTATSNLGFFRQVGGALALAIADTGYTRIVHDRAAAGGIAHAAAGATAAVVPWLAAVGAVSIVVAALLMPRRPDVAPGSLLARPAPSPSARTR